MSEFLDRLEQLVGDGTPAVLATLVATEGARPRRPGAKLLIGADGAVFGSVTLGGCVEGRVAEAAASVLASGRPRLLRVDLAAEEAFDLGLSCSATLELLVEPVPGATGTDSSLHAAARWTRQQVAAGHAVALVVRLGGTSDRLAVRDDGRTLGSLGDATLDRTAAAYALDALERRTSRVAAAHGDERLFIDVFAPAVRVCVFGVGPVTGPLVRFARELGMDTVVVDAREGARASVGDAGDVRIGSPGAIAAELAIGPNDAVVVLSHDYKYELPVLETVLRGDAGYIGLLGSRRRGEAVRALLLERGVPGEALARVHVPAGLDLGVEAPAEIALSILAQVLALRSGRGRPAEIG